MVARWFRVLDVEGLGIGSCLLIKKGGNPGEEKEASGHPALVGEGCGGFDG